MIAFFRKQLVDGHSHRRGYNQMMTPMKLILDGGRYFEGPRWHAGPAFWFGRLHGADTAKPYPIRRSVNSTPKFRGRYALVCHA